jgi:hypothetical protein
MLSISFLEERGKTKTVTERRPHALNTGLFIVRHKYKNGVTRLECHLFLQGDDS